MSVINTNIQAISAARNLNKSQEMLGRSINRLSSGSKIVKPSDNAAGLAISEKLEAQSLRVNAASTNVQNAVSFIQTADGYMGSMAKILSRMSELGSLSRDVTKNSSDLDLYEEEFSALQEQLRSTIGGTTSEIGGTADIDAPLGMFNGMTLFGANPAGIPITIGQDAGQSMSIGESNLRTGAIKDLIHQDSSGAFDLQARDAGAITKITDAIQQIASQRATLGASQSRLELAGTTLRIESENLESAISGIRDVDVASESTQMAKYNILVQSGTAMLAQANQSPEAVLKLLQR